MKLKFIIINSLACLVLIVPCSQAQWVLVNGNYFRSSPVTAFAVIAEDLFVSTSVNGSVFISTDNGVRWSNTNFPQNNGVYALGISGKSLFAGTENGSVFRYDQSARWTHVNIGLPPNTSVSDFATIGTNLFAGIHNDTGFFLSTDNGNTWVSMNVGLPNAYIGHFAVIGTNLFATSGVGIILSTNNGTDWTLSSAGLPPNNGVSALGVMGTTLYAGMGGGWGIFRSIDSGKNWMNIGLTDIDVVPALVVSGSNLFAELINGFDGTLSGVFLSTDFGTSWTSVNEGLPTYLATNFEDTSVTAFVVCGTNLFAGSTSGNIWRRPLSEMIRQSSVMAESVTKNQIRSFPNPFKKSTKIKFTSESGPAEVSIINLLGVKVAGLYHGELEAGEHSFEWDGQGNATGTYFCIVRAGTHMERKSIRLQR